VKHPVESSINATARVWCGVEVTAAKCGENA
jgi:hypothetical protein